jgi:TPR repeat protein
VQSSHQDNYLALLERSLEGESLAINILLSHLDANLNDIAKHAYQKILEVSEENPNYSQALTLLGILNYFGYGTEKNRDKAFTYFEKAVSLDNAEAMAWQAMMLENGEACTINIDRALELYQTAAKRNNPRALYDLANLHTHGRCKFEVNYSKGIEYLEYAIKLKSPEAMNNLAWMLMEGLGRKRDYHASEKLLLTAIEQGYSGAILNLIYLYKFKLTELDHRDDIFKLQMQFKVKLNKLPEVNLGGFTLAIARCELFDMLPEPSLEDGGYKQYYQIVKEMHDAILLAHRFEIFGKRNVNGIEFYLNGADPAIMLNELVNSFRQYVDTQLQSLMSELNIANFKEFNEDEINALLVRVISDLENSIAMSRGDESPSASKSDVVALMPRFQTVGTSMYHVFSLALFDDYFIISDKANYQNRITLYHATNPQTGLVNSIRNNIALMITSNGANVAANDNPASNKLLTSQLFDQSQLAGRRVKVIPTRRQHADICTWLSAKCSLFSVLYFRFYDALVSSGAGEAESQSLCYRYAQLVYKKWTAYDRYQTLKLYLAGYRPDPILLAFICQKYQFRSEKVDFVKLITGSRLVNEVHFVEAKSLANTLIRRLLRDELSTASPRPKSFYTDSDVTLLSEKLTELYLLGGKSALENIFPKIFDLTLFPVKRAVSLIKSAITEEIKIKKTVFQPRLFSNQFSQDQDDDKSMTSSHTPVSGTKREN